MIGMNLLIWSESDNMNLRKIFSETTKKGTEKRHKLRHILNSFNTFFDVSFSNLKSWVK